VVGRAPRETPKASAGARRACAEPEEHRPEVRRLGAGLGRLTVQSCEHPPESGEHRVESGKSPPETGEHWAQLRRRVLDIRKHCGSFRSSRVAFRSHHDADGTARDAGGIDPEAKNPGNAAFVAWNEADETVRTACVAARTGCGTGSSASDTDRFEGNARNVASAAWAFCFRAGAEAHVARCFRGIATVMLVPTPRSLRMPDRAGSRRRRSAGPPGENAERGSR
jgi:hypothetical protein